jgi:DNA-binding MarR family transcriptional regulator
VAESVRSDGASSESSQQIQRQLEMFLRMSSSRSVHARQAEIAGVDLAQPAYMLLRRISQDGPLAMGELARRVHMDPGATARQVGQLERDGLVRRYPSDDDGRVSLVVTTPAGERSHAKIARVLDRHMHGVLSSWSEADRKDFARLLSRFVEDLRARGAIADSAAS